MRHCLTRCGCNWKKKTASCPESPLGSKVSITGVAGLPLLAMPSMAKPISPSTRKHRPREYAYYRCVGNDAYRLAASGSVIIPKVRTDRLEQTVWREVCRLLAEPTRLLGANTSAGWKRFRDQAGEANMVVVDRQIAKLRQGIARLIDGYAEGYLDHEPRIRRFKERLQRLEAQTEQWRDQAQQHVQLQLVIGRLEEFQHESHHGPGAIRLGWTSGVDPYPGQTR